MLVCTPVRLPVAHPYVLHQTHKCGCICFHLYTVVWAFIPSVIGFSASSSSVVGLRRPFSLFVIGCSRCAHVSWRSSAQIMSSREFCFYSQLGKSFIQITCCLAEEGDATTKIGVCKFIRCYEGTGMISRIPEARKPPNSPQMLTRLLKSKWKRTTRWQV